MTSIVDFLTARITEDEHWAQRTQEHAAREADEGRITVRRWLPKGMGQLHNDPYPFPDDPARVLRECAAKRTLIAAHRPVTLHGGAGAKYFDTTAVCASCEPPQFPEDAYPCPTLRALAAIYADDPNYRKEWAL